ncbi:hypothetical protein CsSME_00019811 [Camellia sinensis var. sinensis]
MASEKVMRENVSGEREEIHVQKDILPKITNHFESLAEKVRGSVSQSLSQIPVKIIILGKKNNNMKQRNREE